MPLSSSQHLIQCVQNWRHVVSSQLRLQMQFSHSHLTFAKQVKRLQVHEFQLCIVGLAEHWLNSSPVKTIRDRVLLQRAPPTVGNVCFTPWSDLSDRFFYYCWGCCRSCCCCCGDLLKIMRIDVFNDCYKPHFNCTRGFTNSLVVSSNGGQAVNAVRALHHASMIAVN